MPKVIIHSDVDSLHKFINSELKKNGTQIDDFFYSPYHPDFKDKFIELSCLKKPNIGMLELAEKKWDRPIKRFFLGDKSPLTGCADKFQN